MKMYIMTGNSRRWTRVLAIIMMASMLFVPFHGVTRVEAAAPSPIIEVGGAIASPGNRIEVPVSLQTENIPIERLLLVLGPNAAIDRTRGISISTAAAHSGQFTIKSSFADSQTFVPEGSSIIELTWNNPTVLADMSELLTINYRLKEDATIGGTKWTITMADYWEHLPPPPYPPSAPTSIPTKHEQWLIVTIVDTEDLTELAESLSQAFQFLPDGDKKTELQETVTELLEDISELQQAEAALSNQAAIDSYIVEKSTLFKSVMLLYIDYITESINGLAAAQAALELDAENAGVVLEGLDDLTETRLGLLDDLNESAVALRGITDNSPDFHEDILAAWFNIRSVAAQLGPISTGHQILSLLQDELLEVKSAVESSTAQGIDGNIQLPKNGPQGSIATWTSSNSNVVQINGTTATVHRPEYADGDAYVILTVATTAAPYPNYAAKAQFIVRVLKEAAGAEAAIELARDALALGLSAGDSLLGVTNGIGLPTSGLHGTTISWSSDNTSIIAADGTVIRPPSTGSDETVTLTATISKDGETLTKTFTVHVLRMIEAPSAGLSLLSGQLGMMIVALPAGDTSDELKANWDGLELELRSLELQYGTGQIDTAAAIADYNHRMATAAQQLRQLTIDVLNARLAVLQNTLDNLYEEMEDAEELIEELEDQIEALEDTIEELESDVALLTRQLAELNEELEELAEELEALLEELEQSRNFTKDLLNVNLQFSGTDNESNVQGTLTLPTTGNKGSRIVWTTSNPQIVSINGGTGAVQRPDYSDGDAYVTLTATVTLGELSGTKSFAIRVKKNDPNPQESVQLAKDALAFELSTGDSLLGVTNDIALPTSGLHGTTISWSSDKPAIIAADGTVIRPSSTGSNETVTLTATISKDGQTMTKTFSMQVLKAVQTNEEAVAGAKAALMLGLSSGDIASGVKQDITLPLLGTDGTTVQWSSNDLAAISNLGQVTRPAAGDANKLVTLTATITKGSVTETKTFEIIIVAYAEGKAMQVETTGNDLGMVGNASGITVTARVAARDTADQPTNTVVVFQLLKGSESISIVAFTKENLVSEQVSAQFFRINGTDSAYRVKIFVYDQLSSDLTSVQTSLAEAVELQLVH